MNPADDVYRLIEEMKLKASAELDKRVHDDISRALAESEKTESVRSEPNIWRIIMKSPITKLAAAAVIIIAVSIGVNQFGGSVTSVA
jgi:negative regulator of sigma E activity